MHLLIFGHDSLEIVFVHEGPPNWALWAAIDVEEARRQWDLLGWDTRTQVSYGVGVGVTGRVRVRVRVGVGLG